MDFITNRWVRADDFVGREPILDQIHRRLRRPTWILGNRRAGKTSLLRQIEWLGDSGTWPNTQALFWDVQGAGSSEGLKESLLESLEDKRSLLDVLNLAIDELENASFPDMMLRLRRKIRQSSLTRFLILIDEVEELVEIAANEPNVLGALRKIQDNGERVTIILAGSQRLLDMDETASRTSPFLPDFLPPLLLETFNRDETLELLKRGDIDDQVACQIHEVTYGNPHLVQSLADRFQRLGDLDKAIEDLRHHNVLDYFFRSNFACLKQPYRNWWSEDHLLEQLSDLHPAHQDFKYLEQSALVRASERGTVLVNPLLRIIRESGRTTMELPADIPQSRVEAFTGAFELIDALRSREVALGTLAKNVLGGDTDLARSSATEPNLNILYSTGEDEAHLHQVLDGASPEYVLSQEPDERTAVFLTGLFIYHQLFGQGLFADEEDPWKRAEMLVDNDVGIPSLAESGDKVDPKLGMILLRCLRAKPQHRYSDLDQLTADLLSTHT